ncbi:MAG: hypothetical protein Q7R47_00745 [Candidatus Diapherotrites archaeon]|nr:hypothetical protein [Candidatus Diapherotrites archaeon]
MARSLAFFKQESSFGFKGLGAKNKNPGNIKKIFRVKDKKGRIHLQTDFARYDRFEDGIEAWFKLIAQGSNYYKANRYTLDDIAPKYAPSNENATGDYIQQIRKTVSEYRELESATPETK